MNALKISEIENEVERTQKEQTFIEFMITRLDSNTFNQIEARKPKTLDSFKLALFEIFSIIKLPHQLALEIAQRTQKPNESTLKFLQCIEKLRDHYIIAINYAIKDPAEKEALEKHIELQILHNAVSNMHKEDGIVCRARGFKSYKDLREFIVQESIRTTPSGSKNFDQNHECSPNGQFQEKNRYHNFENQNNNNQFQRFPKNQFQNFNRNQFSGFPRNQNQNFNQNSNYNQETPWKANFNQWRDNERKQYQENREISRPNNFNNNYNNGPRYQQKNYEGGNYFKNNDNQNRFGSNYVKNQNYQQENNYKKFFPATQNFNKNSYQNNYTPTKYQNYGNDQPRFYKENPEEDFNYKNDNSNQGNSGQQKPLNPNDQNKPSGTFVNQQPRNF